MASVSGRNIISEAGSGHFVLVDMLESGKIDVHEDLSDFERGQVVMAGSEHL